MLVQLSSVHVTQLLAVPPPHWAAAAVPLPFSRHAGILRPCAPRSLAPAGAEAADGGAWGHFPELFREGRRSAGLPAHAACLKLRAHMLV